LVQLKCVAVGGPANKNPQAADRERGGGGGWGGWLRFWGVGLGVGLGFGLGIGIGIGMGRDGQRYNWPGRPTLQLAGTANTTEANDGTGL
jgi:hypothetical protein